MNELLGLGLSDKYSERNTDRIGRYVEEFYHSASYQSEEEGDRFGTHSYLVIKSSPFSSHT
ncbi:MAG: hypothetical protein ACI9RM_001724 [Ulvibacter sp.]|jgi:hypothetical protein